MFDLGFVSAIMPDYTFEEVVEFAAHSEFRCVEMMCWPKGGSDARRYAGVTHIDVESMDVAAIQSFLKKNRVYVSGLGYYPNPLDPDDKNSKIYVDHIKKVIKGAAKIGVPVVNTFVGRDPAKNVDYNLGRYKEVFADIVKVAEQEGVKIGIENCPMLFTNDEWPGGKNLAASPAIWDKMFEAIPSDHLGLNYDPSHLVWMQMDEIQPIYDYKDRLHHIHLKDVKVYKEKLDKVGILAYPLDFHSPKIPGYGDVRWGDFFSALSTSGYKGPVCIEVEDKAFEGSPEDIRSAILTSRNYLRQFLS